VAVTIQSNVKDKDRVRVRRAQIIHAAVQLFAEKGFHRTTTREIAKASGLSNGALYEYVSSKEDVLFLVCQHIHREMTDQLKDALREHTEGASRLRHAMQSFFFVVNQMQDEVLVIYQEGKSLPQVFLREVLREEQNITQIFEQLIHEGIADGSLHVDEPSISLLAHNIVVSGQMWAFRRWALRRVNFEEYVDLEIRMLMAACGADL
jgi:TetR/AcrR family transcriptional regulator, cholesterol catabolism regulator